MSATETIVSIKPLLAVLVSALATIPIILFSRRPNLREGVTFLAGAIKFGLVVSMLPPVLQGKLIEYTLFPLTPTVPLQFRVDPMGMLFALVASSLWIITSAYSIGYMRGLKEHSQTRYFAFFALSLSATLGVAFAGNLLTLYLFYEMLSMSTYPLVTHHQDGEARSGGRQYLTYLLGTSVGFALPAILYTYYLTGTLDFTATGLLAGKVSGLNGVVLLMLMVFGFSKAAIMPFHSWLPSAMVAPTPVSALLHAVAVVKVGVFCVLRVITGVFGVQFLNGADLITPIMYFAAFTVIVSSLIALSQDNLKRRLAFSTIGQLSYIVLGATLLSPKALTGSMVHIAMHAFGKITLFFCAGAIFVATGKKYISEMMGIGRQMPITMTAFFIGSMSVVGLPFTGGFLSKLYLIWGAVEADRMAMMVVYLISSFLNAAYFFPIVYHAFFSEQKNPSRKAKFKEAPAWCVVPLSLTALGSMVLFFHPEPFFTLAEMMVQRLFGG
ncbi:MAG: monovalent cation/H+ antiporter subunit D family protein [Calditrichaeota bacterium]|nr:MAG: monovalent cation/H+ antiporter subunit D family protein [Calditrichota bacterium]